MRAGHSTKDPTPRNLLMLRLLSLDPGPAVFIGRPCYHGLARTAGCSPELWTTARYSDHVVASLAAAIRHVMMRGGFYELALFGHSGGGTLAVLLAERLTETKAVITIAPNLDVDAWTDHHGYSALTGSLNPASRPPLPKDVTQHHYFGGRDRVIPSALVTPAAMTSNAQVTIVQGFDHVCCWAQIWSDILLDLHQTADSD